MRCLRMQPAGLQDAERGGLAQVTLPFPAVLDRLGIRAFDMCKLVDAFVRAEPGLLKEIRKHLFGVQERIVECLAWQRNSTLYPLMQQAVQPPQQPQQVGARPPAGGLVGR